jgi:hypothetical protein
MANAMGAAPISSLSRFLAPLRHGLPRLATARPDGAPAFTLIIPDAAWAANFKDIMTTQTLNALRPKLTLPFGGRRPAATASSLSGSELRRIVSEMLG